MMRKVWNISIQWLWRILLLLLPFTSVPLVGKITKSQMVANPSGLILAILMMVWFIPYCYKKGCLPGQVKPLGWFLGAAVLSTLLSVFNTIPTVRDASVFRNILEGLVTLTMGICFFLAAGLFPSSEKEVKTTLRWINWGGLILIVWCFVQGAAWYAFKSYPSWLKEIHDLYSTGPLFRARVSGFAFEPSWLAHQLNMLYLPYWLAACIKRFSAHSFRIWKFTLEDFLLAAGVGILLLTLSRVGLMAFFLMIAVFIIRYAGKVVTFISSQLVARQVRTSHKIVNQKMMAASIYALIGVLFIGMAVGGMFILKKGDFRNAAIFEFNPSEPDAVIRYANRLNFASRMVYWQAGWQIFDTYPILGVGIGNAGFYMPDALSNFGASLSEVRDLLYRDSSLMNIKSIWMRILAETGIVGFVIFLAFLYLIWKTAVKIEQSSLRLQSTTGLAGMFVLVGLLIEGFSIDSFALPYIWFSLGLVVATHRIIHME